MKKNIFRKHGPVDIIFSVLLLIVGFLALQFTGGIDWKSFFTCFFIEIGLMSFVIFIDWLLAVYIPKRRSKCSN